MAIQINNDLKESSQLDQDAMASVEGGFTFAPIMLAGNLLWHRYTYGADSYALPSGSTVYTNGGGDYVGIEDSSKQMSYAL